MWNLFGQHTQAYITFVFVIIKTIHSIRMGSTCKKSYMILKLEMQKAYDHIKLPFLCQPPWELGLHGQRISWIRECTATISYSLSIIMIHMDSCTPSRGIRWGDALAFVHYIYGSLGRKTFTFKLISLKSDKGIQISSSAVMPPNLINHG